MPLIIFYSWQDDTPNEYNRHFIFTCIEAAVKKLRPEFQVDKDFFVVMKDTTGAPGWVGLADEIQDRIKQADIYIADLTFGSINEVKNEGRPNLNVADEVGMAKFAVGPERIIAVMNTAYGKPELLPFNNKHRRWPVDYELNEKTESKEKVKTDLINSLKSAIKSIIELKGERSKDHYRPFVNWENWKGFLGPLLPFEINDAITTVFQQIRASILTPKTIFRLRGLSCQGKTRMLYECFRLGAPDVPVALNSAVLYADMSKMDRSEIIKAIVALQKVKEQRILVIDNCPKNDHFDFCKMIRSEGGRLSLITVSDDPAETLVETDAELSTTMLYLNNKAFKDVVGKILDHNYGDKLSTEDRQALIDFSDGLPYVAVLMAINPERPNLQPGTITVHDIVRRLLGDLYTDPQKRIVVMATALFSQFGYTQEMAFQGTAIAQSKELCPFNLADFNTEDHAYRQRSLFKAGCEEMIKRGLLTQNGRALSFRLSPLAINMAQEWWSTCTPAKFERIRILLEKEKLTDYFCQQFRYLPYHDQATEIVGELCKGAFSSAEVLNTKTGSRLFRSFVNVNAVACSIAISTAFSEMTQEELLTVEEGRRNLVWALEKLCLRKETFDQASRVMAAFAVAENEQIGNNATGQFIQLFHVWLPGTRSDLEARWRVLQDLSELDGYQELVIKALGAALTVGQRHRMGIPEETGDQVTPTDYQPKTQSEVNTYREKCISQLAQFAERGEYSLMATAILLEKFFGLCADFAGALIVPVVKKLYDTGRVEKEDLRKRVQLALGSGRVIEKDVLASLQELLSTLEPTTFVERFVALVKSPSREEYRPRPVSNIPVETLETNVLKLAGTFVDGHREGNLIPPEMVSGNINEGYRFGKDIGTLTKKKPHVLHAIIRDLCLALKTIPADKRNFSIVAGLLTGFDSTILDQSLFNGLLEDPDLATNGFLVARERPLPFEQIERLIESVEKGIFPATLLSNFYYGLGLKHLSVEEVKTLLNRIRQVNDQGKATAFFILEGWTRGDEKASTDFFDLLHSIVRDDSPAILNIIKSSMDLFEWGEACLKVLQNTHDDLLVEKLMDLIIDQSNELEYFYNKDATFAKLLSYFEEHSFAIFWQKFAALMASPGDKGMALFQLRELLGSRHDYMGDSLGILFKGGQEHFNVIMKWAEQQDPENLRILANMLPVFHTGPVSDKWHPYAKAFIDKFGNHRGLLAEISAKLGTYSWTGSVVERLKMEKQLYQKLINHEIPVVKEWATERSKELDKRIQSEDNRDKDGYLGDWIVSGSL